MGIGSIFTLVRKVKVKIVKFYSLQSLFFLYNATVMSTVSLWNRILAEFFHQKGELDRIPMSRLWGVSLFLRKRYEYFTYNIAGVAIVSALDSKLSTGEHATRAKQHVQEMEARFGVPCVLLIQQMPASKRKRYVENAIPFITQDGFAYIPAIYMKLKRSRQTQPHESSGRLGPTAQAILLRHLICNDVNAKSMGDLSDIFRCTKMNISLAKDELLSLKLCAYEGTNRSARICFPCPAEELWKQSQRALQSPVQKIVYTSLPEVTQGLPLAGESALAEQSLLSAPHLPTYAVSRKQAAALHAARKTHNDDETATAQLQVWRYDPALLIPDSAQCVDTLSLYLSLKDSADDRVLQELHTLPLPWNLT